MRKRHKRRGTSRVVVVLTGLVLCAGLGWVGAVAARPFIVAGHISGENARLEGQIKEAKQERERLRKAVAALETDAGREREARRYGYMRPDEVPLVLPQRTQNP